LKLHKSRADLLLEQRQGVWGDREGGGGLMPGPGVMHHLPGPMGKPRRGGGSGRYYEDEEEYEEDFESYQPYEHAMGGGLAGGLRPPLGPTAIQRARMQGEELTPARENGYRLASMLGEVLWRMRQQNQIDPIKARRVL